VSNTRMPTIGLVALATGAVAVATAGITFASTTSAGVKACANSAGTLRLLSAHGHCPHHYSKVTIAKTGPRGKRGASGPAGASAQSLVADTTSTTTTRRDQAPVGSTGLTVEAVCRASDTSDLYLLDTTGSSSYVVEGSYFYNGSGPAYLVYNGAQQGSFSVGSGQIAFAQDAEKNASAELVNQGGQLTASILLTRGTSTFTVDVGSNQSATRCYVHAQVTPGK
jgi:hypothetical protein